jgi:hypothetical protein
MIYRTVFKLLFALYAFGCFSAFAQNADTSLFSLSARIELGCKYMQTDRLGNVFVVSKTNQLYKYNSQGKLLSTLNYKYLGNISSVDPTNPLEVYVFYKELNMVLFLDNNLAYRGELNLSDYGIIQAAAIARSYDNGIWVFDIGDMQLKKMNKAGEILQQSGNVRQFMQQPSVPSYIIDDNNRVYINDPTNGVLVFDIFANYKRTLNIKSASDFKIIKDDIFFESKGALVKYNIIKMQQQEIYMPQIQPSIIDMSIEKDFLFLMSEKEVCVYNYTDRRVK